MHLQLNRWRNNGKQEERNKETERKGKRENLILPTYSLTYKGTRGERERDTERERKREERGRKGEEAETYSATGRVLSRTISISPPLLTRSHAGSSSTFVLTAPTAVKNRFKYYPRTSGTIRKFVIREDGSPSTICRAKLQFPVNSTRPSP